MSAPLASSQSELHSLSTLLGIRLTKFRIVRDYEKYISRQLKRGTSRQELNISWLKKNELDIKRNMAELKDNIKNNWTTTGQELGAELRKFWQSSRPGSPARTPVTEKSEAASLMSPSALSRLTHLDIPRANGSSSDFAAGYSLGLIGGVRTWVIMSLIIRGLLF